MIHHVGRLIAQVVGARINALARGSDQRFMAARVVLHSPQHHELRLDVLGCESHFTCLFHHLLERLVGRPIEKLVRVAFLARIPTRANRRSERLDCGCDLRRRGNLAFGDIRFLRHMRLSLTWRPMRIARGTIPLSARLPCPARENDERPRGTQDRPCARLRTWKVRAAMRRGKAECLRASQRQVDPPPARAAE